MNWVLTIWDLEVLPCFGLIRKFAGIETPGFNDGLQSNFEGRIHVDGFFENPDEFAQILGHAIMPLLRTDFVEVGRLFPF